MDINLIRNYCNDENIIITQHALLRLRQKNIKYSDVKNAILTGDIIEEYPDDFPYPSCLISGFGKRERVHLHTVVGINIPSLWIITAYYPTTDKWYDDYKPRRK